MSDTPLTDMLVCQVRIQGAYDDVVRAMYVRQMERQLNERTRERDEARESLRDTMADLDEARSALREMLATLVAEGPNEGNIICDSKQIKRWRKAAGME
jgi:hypothetical protein